MLNKLNDRGHSTNHVHADFGFNQQEPATVMYTQGAVSLTIRNGCPTSTAPGARQYVTSMLDVWKGQSGAPLWSDGNIVRAVHCASGQGQSKHAPIDKNNYNFIRANRK